MIARTKLNAALLATLAAAATLPAFAATEEVTSAYVVPAPDSYTVPSTTYYYVPSTSDYYYAPSTTTVYYEPPVIVEAPRSSDQAINDDVVDTIAGDPRIAGRIGVDTFHGDVTLN